MLARAAQAKPMINENEQASVRKSGRGVGDKENDELVKWKDKGKGKEMNVYVPTSIRNRLDWTSWRCLKQTDYYYRS